MSLAISVFVLVFDMYIYYNYILFFYIGMYFIIYFFSLYADVMQPKINIPCGDSGLKKQNFNFLFNFSYNSPTIEYFLILSNF